MTQYLSLAFVFSGVLAFSVGVGMLSAQRGWRMMVD